jgi:hypothetical protein
MGISTRNLENLPDVMRLRRLFQSMAMLDAILMPEREYRCCSFDAHWAEGEMMGAMRDGQGDELFAFFNMHGAFLKGFDHESDAAALPSQHFYCNVPVQFEQCTREPAFSPGDVTFCVWRLSDQPRWSCNMLDLSASHDPDGSAHILSMFDGVPETYRAWATEYFNRDLPLEPIESVYQHRSLTNDLVVTLNPQQSLALLNSEIVEIGYAV